MRVTEDMVCGEGALVLCPLPHWGKGTLCIEHLKEMCAQNLRIGLEGETEYEPDAWERYHLENDFYRLEIDL